MNLLEVQQLNISFQISSGTIEAIRDVSFNLEQGEALGIVGESGSGKSVTSLAILRLLATNATVNSGKILFSQDDLLKKSEREMQKIRGKKISMIFQDPMSSLDPCFTIADQLKEVFLAHNEIGKADIQNTLIELLNKVGIPEPKMRLNQYPHEFSGGMSQRIMIAMAIACHPQILIADEPTTALDVTVQAQILRLLKKLRQTTKMSLILVSHDLAMIAQNTDQLIVMYAGEIVERGPSHSILRNPQHPYTKALLKSRPDLRLEGGPKDRLATIPGLVPDLRERPKGCQFYPRCEFAKEICQTSRIQIKKMDDREVRCLLV